MRMLFVTTYDVDDQSLGGASWVDNQLLKRLAAFGNVEVMTIASTRSANDVPLEVTRNLPMLLKTLQLMILRAKPYQEAKFVWHRNWKLKAQHLTQRAAQVDLIITSQWPALLLASEAGIRPHAHFAHNVDWVLSELHDPLLFRLLRNAQRMRTREIDLLANSNAILTLSRSDARKLRQHGLLAEHLVMNADDVIASKTDTGNIGFIGKMTWPPNKSAVETLIYRILPALNREREEPVEVVLAGRGSEQYSDTPFVRALGVVNEVGEFYDLVDLVVIPRTGESTGISVKMLEAASYGKMVIAPGKLIDDAGLGRQRAIAADSTSEIVEKARLWFQPSTNTTPGPACEDASPQQALSSRLQALADRSTRNEASVGSLQEVWRCNTEKWIGTLKQLIDLAFADGRSSRVQTVNLHHMFLASKRADFRRSIATADMLSADGWPIVSAVNRLTNHQVSRVTGSDFLVQLLSDVRIKGRRIALIGASENAHKLLAERLSNAGATLVYSDFANRDAWDVAQISAALIEANPNITLVAVTPPFGDLVATKLRESHTPGFIIGVGGAVDMLLGIRKRAPQAVQRARLEWFYRLVQDPKHLLRRYVLECGPAYYQLQALNRAARRNARVEP